MIPDRLGYFLDDFGNFENLVKIWTRRPPNYYQNASKITRTIMESSWTILFMSIWDTTKSNENGEMYILGTGFVRCVFFLFLACFVFVFFVKTITCFHGIREFDTTWRKVLQIVYFWVLSKSRKSDELMWHVVTRKRERETEQDPISCWSLKSSLRSTMVLHCKWTKYAD